MLTTCILATQLWSAIIAERLSVFLIRKQRNYNKNSTPVLQRDDYLLASLALAP